MFKFAKSGISAFAGIGEAGFTLDNVDIGFALFTDGTRGWISGKATANEVAFGGLDSFDISATSVDLTINSAWDGVAIDFSAKEIEISDTITLDSSIIGEIYAVSGTLDVNLFNFFTVNGDFSFEKSTKNETI